MRVSNESGRPIPEPAKWENGRCPKCRLELAFDEGGRDAEIEMGEALGLRRRRPVMAKSDEKPPKPQRTSTEVDALRERVREVVLAHPDWNSEQVGEKVGIPARTASRYRADLGLNRQRGATDEQREQIEGLLTGEPQTDTTIAEAVGVNTFAVVEARRKLDMPPYRTRVKRERERRVAEVAAEHPEWGHKRIAAELGEPLNNVRRALNAVRKSTAAAAA
jgi:hypothetical protein